MHKLLKKFRILLVPMLLMAFALVCILVYLAWNTSVVREKTYDTLATVAEERIVSFQARIEAKHSMLESVAAIARGNCISEATGTITDRDELLSVMADVQLAGGFTYIGYAQPDGSSLNSFGASADVSTSDFFQQSLDNEKAISYVEQNQATRSQAIILSVPARQGSNVIGVVYGVFELADVAKALLPANAGAEAAVLCDTDGRIVAYSRFDEEEFGGENVIEYLSQVELTSGSLEQIGGNLLTGRSGTIGYRVDDITEFVCYVPTGINNWFLFTKADAPAVREQERQTSMQIIVITLILLCIAVLQMLYIYLHEKKRADQLELDRERLRRSEELYRCVEEMSDGILVDIDPTTGAVKFNHRYEGLVGDEDETSVDLLDQLSSIVHPDDLPVWRTFNRRIRAHDDNEGECELRLYNQKKRTIWYRLIFRKLRDPSGRVYRIVCKLTDISEQKKRIEKLRNLAERDSLTGLLNHETFAERVNTLASTEGEHALLIIDVDDFKRVNDVLGHFEGDCALIGLTGEMKRMYASPDFVGRLGGDEFGVILRDVSSREEVRRKAQELCTRTRSLRIAGSQHNGTLFTISIGIRMFKAEENLTFAELYQEADAALYNAKNKGKNQLIFFSDLEEDELEFRGIVDVSDENEIVPLGNVDIQMRALLTYMQGGVVLFEIGEEAIIPLYISPSYYSLPGSQNTIEVGKDFISAVYEQDAQRLHNEMRDGVREGRAVEIIYRMPLPDGSVCWRQMRSVEIPYDASEHPVVIAAITDVTEMQTANMQLRALIDNVPGGVLLIEYDGERPVVTYANDGAIDLVGVSREEFYTIVSENELPFIVQRDADNLREIAQKIMCEGGVFESVYHAHKTDGHSRWTLVRGVVMSSTPEKRQMLIMLLDMTDQKRLERRLKADQEKMRIAFEQTKALFWEYDPKTDTMHISDEAVAEWGIAQSVWSNMPSSFIDSGLVHPDSHRVLHEFYNDIHQGEKNCSCVVKMRRKNGQYGWMRLSTTSMFDDSNVPYLVVGICEAVTELVDAKSRFEREERRWREMRDSTVAMVRINVSHSEVETLIANETGRNRSVWDCPCEVLMQHFEDVCASETDRRSCQKFVDIDELEQAYTRNERWRIMEYRYIDGSGHIVWAEAVANLLIEPGSGDLYAFVYIRNVDERKKCELSLSSKIELNELEIYSSEFVTELIDTYVKRTAAGAMMVVDVVNYQYVVQQLGVRTAVAAVESARQCMHLSIPACGVYGMVQDGRIVIFVPDIHSSAQLLSLCDLLMNELQSKNMPFDDQGLISFSIGAAIMQDDDGFDTLYAKACVALEGNDNIGSGKVSLYSTDSYAHLLGRTSAAAQHGQTDRDSAAIIAGCTSRLLGSDSLRKGISDVLEEIGAYYSARRVYLLEYDEEAQTLRKSYEWSASGFALRNEELLSYPLEQFPVHRQAYELGLNILLPSLESISESAPGEYAYLSERGIGGLMLVPFTHQDGSTGIMGIDNPIRHEDDASLCSSAGYLISAALAIRKMREREKFLDTHDELTELLNHNSFITNHMKKSEDAATSLGVLCIDVNDLQGINQRFGHAYGNNLLRHIARSMLEQFPHEECYRMYGDDFVVLSEDLTYAAFTERAQAVLSSIEAMRPGCVCIGYTWSDTDINVDKLKANAEEILSVAKMQHAQNEESSVSEALEHMRVNLIAALDSGMFHIYLQPKADVVTGEVVGAEALVRLIHNTLGIITPEKYIPMLEEEGMIRYIDYFMFEEVCRTLQKWNDNGVVPVPISVNFSRATLFEPHFDEELKTILDRYTIDSSLIEVEITESFGSMEREVLVSISTRLSALGIGLSLDDFGSKYSSLAILSAMAFTSLKIDKSIVYDLATNTMSRNIINNVLTLCRSAGLTTIAEGVETEEQMMVLREFGCQLMQGYYINKALSVEDFEQRYLKAKV